MAQLKFVSIGSIYPIYPIPKINAQFFNIIFKCFLKKLYSAKERLRLISEFYNFF